MRLLDIRVRDLHLLHVVWVVGEWIVARIELLLHWHPLVELLALAIGA